MIPSKWVSIYLKEDFSPLYKYAGNQSFIDCSIFQGLIKLDGEVESLQAALKGGEGV